MATKEERDAYMKEITSLYYAASTAVGKLTEKLYYAGNVFTFLPEERVATTPDETFNEQMLNKLARVDDVAKNFDRDRAEKWLRDAINFYEKA